MLKNFLTIGAFMLLSVQASAQLAPGQPGTVDTQTLFPICEGLKNTYLGTGKWIFENWEMQDNFQFTTLQDYKQLQDSLERRGRYLVALPIPARPYRYINTVNASNYPDLHFSSNAYRKSWESMINAAKQKGINVIDILPLVDKFQVSSRNENFYYTGDHHWTTSGAQVSAELAASYIADLMKSKGQKLSSSPKDIKEERGHDQTGSFNDHYMRACNYKTMTGDLASYKETVTDTAGNLLDDVKPDIGVFGDSFGLGQPDNNFAPFLEFYSKAKVVNYSSEGGGFFGAMLGYFADPNVNKNLPKVIIIPFQGNFLNDTFSYKQTVAVLNSCRDKIPASDNIVNIISGKSEYALNYNKSLLSSGNVIHVKFDNSLNNFNINVKYKNNTTKSINIGRYFPENYRGSRTDYYIPLDDYKNLAWIGIVINDKGSVSKTISTSLCKS